MGDFCLVTVVKLLMLSIRPRMRMSITYGVCIRRMGGLCKVVELAGGQFFGS